MATRVAGIWLVAGCCFTVAIVCQVAARGQDAGNPVGEVQQANYLAEIQSEVHPLTPVLKWAQRQTASIRKDVADYSAVLVSRERSDGKLCDPESVFVKVRHQPFSVYIRVLTPENHQGDEAIYVEGKNDGKLLGHTTGITGRLVGTVSLDPAGKTAMEGQRHPITEIGILNLCQRMIRFIENDMRFGESQVRFLREVKVNDSDCTCIEVVHPIPRKNFQFHRVRVWVDEQLKLPIRYEQCDWPKEDGAAPEVVEEYTYLRLKLNNGFGDADFDPQNPEYGFP